LVCGEVVLAGEVKGRGSGEEKEEGLLSMVGERVGSREGRWDLAQGAMSGLALEEEAHRVGQALGKARAVPDEAELMAQMDVQFAAYQAKWERGQARKAQGGKGESFHHKGHEGHEGRRKRSFGDKCVPEWKFGNEGSRGGGGG
jgi:hypothetical protein